GDPKRLGEREENLSIPVSTGQARLQCQSRKTVSFIAGDWLLSRFGATLQLRSGLWCIGVLK
ncbi:hypothetical protein, partial [Escherichia coli]|uniref:hypothetical protein n=1 Tax=Escherichia coli TaxID=562 RepID=UPI001C598E50